MKKLNTFLIVISILLVSCKQDSSVTADQPKDTSNHVSDRSEPLFTLLKSNETGIAFNNKNIENDRYNFYTYEYFYNGGGVAVADFNNDGLQDIFFTANMGLNKLYINTGDLKFQDITSSANVNSGDRDWCTGATILDVNGDGWQDIFVSRSGWFKGESKRLLRNLLFVNNGDLTFTESAEAYGFTDLSPTTQTCFFDADNDGDLDAYQINHPTIFKTFNQYSNGELKKIDSPDDDYSDKLYINTNGKFVDKTNSYGLQNSGHGLGILASDFNNDGWQDLYISNDYLEPDYLYINQKNGSFKNEIFSALKHISKFSMGVDAADINNDGFQDIFNAEMLAKDNFSKKANMAPMDVASYWLFVNEGLHYQDMHNSLQLNNGNGTFSEISWLSNVAETDWSWCPLFADFDNDGFKDLFVTNGYKRDVLSKDFSKNLEKQMEKTGTMRFTEFSHLIPTKKISNIIFRNNKDLTFSDKTSEWGLKYDFNSNGAAYADFDNDGDLDIVINNLNDEAVIFKNNLNGKENYLKLKLLNGTKIPFGSKVEILDEDNYQVSELRNARGYQSSSDLTVHFGLNKRNSIDSVLITWPNQKKTLIKDLALNKMHTIDYAASEFIARSKNGDRAKYFKDITVQVKVNYVHKEDEFDDYAREVLLPHKLSQEGPFFDVADVNNDGLDDFFIGNGVGHAGQLFVQSVDGSFKSTNKTIFNEDRKCEDLGVLFFDADNDGDQDLYVVSGSNEYDLESQYMQDRLYINDGSGNFKKSKDLLPVMKSSSYCVEAADFDDDGDLDLFVGGFLTPGAYPKHGESFLLENRDGKFIDITDDSALGLKDVGMVKAAAFSDINGDNKVDLIITGHWMPIEIFLNTDEGFIRNTENYGTINEIGWWNTLIVEDIDNDGFKDIVAGNLGTNTKHKASPSEPFKVYAKDFDQSGTNDVVLGYYNAGELYPVRGKQCSAQQLPEIDDKIKSYDEFGSLKLDQIYGNENLSEALSYSASNFRTSVFKNVKGTGFSMQSLPNQTQLAPVNGILSLDINKDKHPELMLIGNHFPVEVETGRYDAHVGNLLLNDAKGERFEHLPSINSGFFTDRDNRDIGKITINGRLCVMVASNRNRLQFFALN